MWTTDNYTIYPSKIFTVLVDLASLPLRKTRNLWSLRQVLEPYVAF